MYEYKKIRKNARKKIIELLDQSVGIVGRTSKMQIDDSYDDGYKVVSKEDVLSFLDDDLNYQDAKCYMVDNTFIVSGPYYFCDKFTAYFDCAEFEAELALHDLSDKPQNDVVHVDLQSNVVHVDFKNKRLC